MPWEVIAFRCTEKLPPYRELPTDWRPEAMGTTEEVRARLSAQLPELEWDSHGFAGCGGDGFSFEIYVPRDQPVTGVSFDVRGSGDPLPELVRIAKANGWCLLDEAMGAWIDLESPSREGWQRFQAYRDRAVGAKPGGAPSSQAHRPRAETPPLKANPEHLAAAKQGTKVLTKWIREHPFQLLALSGADLQGIDLSGAILTGCDFRGTDLAGANLSEAKMQAAKLRAANLSKANLSRAKMDGCDLRDANLNGAVLAGADLGGDQLGEANLIGTNLCEADLTDANLTGVVVEVEDWFGALRQRQAAPRDIDRLEALWRTAPAGRLKIVVGGILGPEAAARQWFQIWPRGKRRSAKRR